MKQFLDEIYKYADSENPSTLIQKAAKETDADKRLLYCFAACYGASIQALSLTPYEEQLYAALDLYKGTVVQMATGEGKTLSAVFAAVARVIEGRNVHILTFNDYLAKRDYNWMKPVYDLLGISVSFITEKTPKEERKEAYKAQVTYLTAKESGFDYLRDCTAFSEEDTVQNGLDFAIVDEADSIMIDEGQLPLVIAGEYPAVHEDMLPDAMAFVESLEEQDYEISYETENAFLTDRGVQKAEEHFSLDNLFDEEHTLLLTLINDCLKARYQLKENKDYIYRENRIFVVDRLTGRTAQDRNFPGYLQSALELMFGIKRERKSVIMGSIPIQFFLRRYQTLSGMTGTAILAEEEFGTLYDLPLTVIPPHKTNCRVDHPIQVFSHSKAKWDHIVDAVITAHEKGQPVLVGSGSIEESEMLYKRLTEAGIENVVVLNAKNDEMEAEIIKNAGAYRAVTISTNMAGRGVDIRLGGADESERQQVVDAGGLLTIATELSQSRRINDQLRGRAGRQGDIGESRVFCALDDALMVKYKIRKLLPGKQHFFEKSDQPITDKAVLREVERIQRISEGDLLDMRSRMLRFTTISEKHHDIIFTARKKYMNGESEPTFWQTEDPELYEQVCERFGTKAVEKLQRDTILAVLTDCWCDYIEFTVTLRQGIHLTAIAGKSPSEEFNIACEEYFGTMEEDIRNRMMERLMLLSEADNIEQANPQKPLSVRTYLLDDSGDELNKKPFLYNLLDGPTSDDAFDLEPSEKEQNENETKIQEKSKKKGFFGLFKRN